MDEPDNALLPILDAYKAAVLAKDVDAFLSLYAHDVRVFDLWGAWSHDGAEAWRAMVAGWFGSLGSERVVVDFDQVQATMSGELAVLHAFVRYQGVSADGEPLRAMSNRMSLVFRQMGNGWRIVHEHTSAPVDFDTGKAILQR